MSNMQTKYIKGIHDLPLNHEIYIYSKSAQQISVFCLDLEFFHNFPPSRIVQSPPTFNWLYGRIWPVCPSVVEGQGEFLGRRDPLGQGYPLGRPIVLGRLSQSKRPSLFRRPSLSGRETLLGRHSWKGKPSWGGHFLSILKTILSKLMYGMSFWFSM